MSTQSILTKTSESIRDSAEEQLSKQANSYILKKKYALGRGSESERIKHAIKILNFICSENCDLIETINKSIKGEEIIIENTVDYPKKGLVPICNTDTEICTKQEQSLYQLWLGQGNSGTIQEFLELILDNDIVEWDGELKW